MKTASLLGNEIIIKFKFEFDEKQLFFETVSLIKTLAGRRFIKEKRYWACPASLEHIRKLKAWNFNLDPALLTFQKIKDSQKTPGANTTNLKKSLFPFQKIGVEFIESKNGRALIADDCGLGKTIQTLGYISMYPKLKPVIIVCPSVIKINWERETNAWLKEKLNICILSGRKSFHLSENINMFIINYDILPNWEKELKKIKPKIIILDESHYIKSGSALRSKAAIKLCKGVNHIIALSATPIINRPSELYTAIGIIAPGLFKSRWSFQMRYCAPKHNGWGWTFNGSTNAKELHEILTENIMIRRLKKTVLKELPEKIHTVIPIEIDNQKIYDQAQDNIIAWIQDNYGKEKAERASNAEAIVRFERLKQIAMSGKIKQSIKWIENFLESGEKLVIFTTHKETLKIMSKQFQKISVTLGGSTSTTQKQLAVDQFQTNNKIKLFIGNIKAAGVGITLTAASNICFIELPWTPADISQGEGRCHRIGQKNCVNIYHLIAQGTVEEDIMELLDNKQKVLSKILDGKEVSSSSLLSDLMKKFVQ